MSRAPYLLMGARQGYRLGHQQVYAPDHMLLDGLEDAYEKGRHMGYFAEKCAQQYQITPAALKTILLASLSNVHETPLTMAILKRKSLQCQSFKKNKPRLSVLIKALFRRSQNIPRLVTRFSNRW